MTCGCLFGLGARRRALLRRLGGRPSAPRSRGRARASVSMTDIFSTKTRDMARTGGGHGIFARRIPRCSRRSSEHLPLFAQEGFGPFTRDFPPEEFAARRTKVFEAIGPDAFAVLQGAPSPRVTGASASPAEFYYLCGIEVPHAYLLLDGATKKTALYLPHRNEGREKGRGTHAVGRRRGRERSRSSRGSIRSRERISWPSRSRGATSEPEARCSARRSLRPRASP